MWGGPMWLERRKLLMMLVSLHSSYMHLLACRWLTTIYKFHPCITSSLAIQHTP